MVNPTIGEENISGGLPNGVADTNADRQTNHSWFVTITSPLLCFHIPRVCCKELTVHTHEYDAPTHIHNIIPYSRALRSVVGAERQRDD